MVRYGPWIKITFNYFRMDSINFLLTYLISVKRAEIQGIRVNRDSENPDQRLYSLVIVILIDE